MKLKENQLNLIRHLIRFNLMAYEDCLKLLDTKNSGARTALSYTFRPLTKNRYLSKNKKGVVTVLKKGRALFPDEMPLISTATGTVAQQRIMQVSRVAMWLGKCGVPAFARTANDISLQHSGIYHVTATFVASAPAAGVVTVQLLLNGQEVEGAFASETITTAATEFRTLVIDYYILVDDDCILGNDSTVAQTISFQNTGVAATFTSVIVNVSKEV